MSKNSRWITQKSGGSAIGWLMPRWVMAVLAIALACAASTVIAATTSTTISLNWTSKGDDGSVGTAAVYDIRYTTVPITDANWGSATQVTGEPAPKVAGQPESFTITGLTPNTTYYIGIKIADEVPNWSGLSNVITRTTLPESTPPSAIANLALGTKTASSIVVSWTAPGDDSTTGTAAQYDLRYSTSAITAANFVSATAVTGLPAPKAAGNAETFTVTGLSANTTYYFAIETADEVPNWSAISNVPSGATTQETTPPSTVANLGTGSETSSSIRLTWTAPGDDGNLGTATQYDIRYSTSSITSGNFNSATQATGEPSPAAPGTSESFTVAGLNANTTYYFAIKTADEVPNWSALSNIASRATLPEQNPPANVTTLAAASAGSNSVLLTWTSVGDDGTTGTATQYDIRFSTAPITAANFSSAPSASNPPVPKVTGQAESFLVSGLAPGTTYYFAMKVADEVPNWSGLSNVPSAATASPDVIPPDPINDLSAAPGTNLGELALIFKATGDDARSGSAALYEIRYSPNPLNITNFGSAALWPTPPIPSPAGTAQSVVLAGLQPGQLMNIGIKVYDEAGNVSGLSNVSSAVVQWNFSTSTDEIASVVAPPSGSIANSSRPTLVVDNILSGSNNVYYFEVATDSNFVGMAAFGTVGEGTNGRTEWQVEPALQSGLTYFWRVSVNSFDYSATASFTVEARAYAYPNPFRPSETPSATFTYLPSGSRLFLMSVSGEPVREWAETGSDVSWDGTNASGQPVASGIYLWSVVDSNLKGKIVVIR
jgi:phosphodiesterase/alkaline phosphatase D-like protein